MRPVRGGLEGVRPVAGGPQRVAQVRRAEPGPVPGRRQRRDPRPVVPPEHRGGLRAGGLRDPAPPRHADQEQDPVAGPAADAEVRGQRAGLRRAVREGEERPCLGGRREAEEGEAGPGLHELPDGIQALSPARERPGLHPLLLGERSGAQDDVGQEAETALGAQDELAEVRAGGRCRVGRHVQGPGRGLQGPTRVQLLDPPDAEALQARSARRDPAADGGQLPGLRLVTDGQAPGRQLGGKVRAGDPGANGGEPAALVHPAHRVQPREVHGDEGVRARAGADPADDAGAAAVRDQAGSLLARDVDDVADVRVGQGAGDGVGNRLEAAGAERDEVRERLAAGPPDPELRIRGEEGIVAALQAAGRDGGHDLRQGRVPWPDPRAEGPRPGTCARTRPPGCRRPRRPSRSSVACVHRARSGAGVEYRCGIVTEAPGGRDVRRPNVEAVRFATGTVWPSSRPRVTGAPASPAGPAR